SRKRVTWRRRFALGWLPSRVIASLPPDTRFHETITKTHSSECFAVPKTATNNAPIAARSSLSPAANLGFLGFVLVPSPACFCSARGRMVYGESRSSRSCAIWCQVSVQSSGPASHRRRRPRLLAPRYGSIGTRQQCLDGQGGRGSYPPHAARA